MTTQAISLKGTYYVSPVFRPFKSRMQHQRTVELYRLVRTQKRNLSINVIEQIEAFFPCILSSESIHGASCPGFGSLEPDEAIFDFPIYFTEFGTGVISMVGRTNRSMAEDEKIGSMEEFNKNTYAK
jgi:hypothetical protein